MNRDPVGEYGGINLYGFVGNHPVGTIDPFGLYESHWILRWFVPGQVAWDNAVTAWYEHNDPTSALSWTSLMIADQALFLATCGTARPTVKPSLGIRETATTLEVGKKTAERVAQLSKDRRALEQVLQELRQQLDNGRNLAAKLKDQGLDVNPRGLGKEINEILPAEIAKAERRLAEVVAELNKLTCGK